MFSDLCHSWPHVTKEVSQMLGWDTFLSHLSICDTSSVTGDHLWHIGWSKGVFVCLVQSITMPCSLCNASRWIKVAAFDNVNSGGRCKRRYSNKNLLVSESRSKKWYEGPFHICPKWVYWSQTFLPEANSTSSNKYKTSFWLTNDQILSVNNNK